jgi:hypothetical protein
MQFNKVGQVVEVDTLVYGKLDDKTVAYQISYNEENENIRVKKVNDYDASYQDEKKMDALFDVDARSRKLINQTVSDFSRINSYSNNNLAIIYRGYRTFSDSLTAIRYLKDDNTYSSYDNLPTNIKASLNPYSGYALSIYEVNNEVKKLRIIPTKYTLNKQSSVNNNNVINESVFSNNNEVVSYYLDQNIGYQLKPNSAATGSRWYTLSKTNDGGNNWIDLTDPFAGNGGAGIDLFFIDESTGFALMGQFAGQQSYLARTDDGGKTFTKVEIDAGSNQYGVLDYYSIPSMVDGKLQVNMNLQALDDTKAVIYQSVDNGKTWQEVN